MSQVWSPHQVMFPLFPSRKHPPSHICSFHKQTSFKEASPRRQWLLFLLHTNSLRTGRSGRAAERAAERPFSVVQMSSKAGNFGCAPFYTTTPASARLLSPQGSPPTSPGPRGSCRGCRRRCHPAEGSMETPTTARAGQRSHRTTLVAGANLLSNSPGSQSFRPVRAARK